MKVYCADYDYQGQAINGYYRAPNPKVVADHVLREYRAVPHVYIASSDDIQWFKDYIGGHIPQLNSKGERVLSDAEIVEEIGEQQKADEVSTELSEVFNSL